MPVLTAARYWAICISGNMLDVTQRGSFPPHVNPKLDPLLSVVCRRLLTQHRGSLRSLHLLVSFHTGNQIFSFLTNEARFRLVVSNTLFEIRFLVMKNLGIAGDIFLGIELFGTRILNMN
jgi:hypothetical protein